MELIALIMAIIAVTLSTVVLIDTIRYWRHHWWSRGYETTFLGFPKDKFK